MTASIGCKQMRSPHDGDGKSAWCSAKKPAASSESADGTIPASSCPRKNPMSWEPPSPMFVPCPVGSTWKPSDPGSEPAMLPGRMPPPPKLPDERELSSEALQAVSETASSPETSDRGR